MKLIKVLFFGILCSILGCNKSNDTDEQNRTQITNNSVIGADVDAIDFWDNSDLVWNDEFNDNSLSTTNWEPQVYDGGLGNTELQNYTANENIEVTNGTLKITAKKTGLGQQTGDYTSARLHSKFAFKYGRAEIRAKLPEEEGNGLWVILSLLCNDFGTIDFPECGNIGMMRYLSYLPNEYTTSAISTESLEPDGPVGNSDSIEFGPSSDGFHIYGILWTDKYIKFYLDDLDNIVFTYRKPDDTDSNDWAFSQPFYFVMNIVVGGEFGGVEGVDDNILPASMEVDFIRVYHAK